MNKNPSLDRIKIFLAALLILGITGCGTRVHIGSSVWDFDPGPSRTPQPTYTSRPTYTPLPTYTPRPTYTPEPTYTFLPAPGAAGQATPAPGEGEISQFAATAKASSQYSQPGWSASQAVGAPDTAQCGDASSAWASKNSNGKDWLLLTYDQPVIPTRIVIYQTYHPGAVSLVQVVDKAGNSITVYQAAPAVIGQCPYRLEIEVKDANKLINSIRVTIDQGNHDGWNEIDAVQLIGRLK
jgi:hypothetical protein